MVYSFAWFFACTVRLARLAEKGSVAAKTLTEEAKSGTSISKHQVRLRFGGAIPWISETAVVAFLLAVWSRCIVTRQGGLHEFLGSRSYSQWWWSTRHKHVGRLEDGSKKWKESVVGQENLVFAGA